MTEYDVFFIILSVCLFVSVFLYILLLQAEKSIIKYQKLYGEANESKNNAFKTVHTLNADFTRLSKDLRIVVSNAHFRDEKGRLGKKGVVPANIERQVKYL